jgi:hypothetical protein
MALRLQWEEERYARVYCRDTLDWQALSWDAQALWCQLNRKATRSGRIDLGRIGRRGVAALLGRAELAQRLDQALQELLDDGCVVLEGSVLVIPDFVEAQEAVSSGAKRMRELRERQREAELEANGSGNGSGDGSGDGSRHVPARDADGTAPGSGDEASRARNDTSRRDETSRNVTSGYSTAGTERHGTPLAGDALSRSFAAELAAEPSQEDQRRGRVLAALTAWIPVHALAVRLKRRSVDGVEADLFELLHKGLVEREEQGSPPVTHWRATLLADDVSPAAAAGGAR